jgi:hypothetical protein
MYPGSAQLPCGLRIKSPGRVCAGRCLTLVRIIDIPVRVHASWLVIYGLIAWSLSAGCFPQVLPDVSARTHWVNLAVARDAAKAGGVSYDEA